jgi:NADH-quinone oxidoreductase subunit G
LLSAQHSNEDNYALLKLGRDGLGANQLFLAGKPAGEGDELLRHPDKNPNTAGATALCGDVAPRPFEQLASAAAAGEVTHVLALGGDVERPELVEQLERLDLLVLLATHQDPLWERADVVLPVCTWAEAGGTYVNARGLAQRSARAIAPLGRAQPAWQLVAELGRSLEQQTPWKTLKDLRSAMQSEPGALAAAGSAADPAAGASA